MHSELREANTKIYAAQSTDKSSVGTGSMVLHKSTKSRYGRNPGAAADSDIHTVSLVRLFLVAAAASCEPERGSTAAAAFAVPVDGALCSAPAFTDCERGWDASAA